MTIPLPGSAVRGSRTGRPIKVAFVCSFLYGAGIENWMVGLRQYSDPAAVQFVRCVVTTSLVDERIVRRLGIPVAVGQAEVLGAELEFSNASDGGARAALRLPVSEG